MAKMTLYDFIGAHRDELIGRCRAKVAKRSSPPPTEAEITHGVPLFLNQLCEELRHGPSNTQEISKSATAHGHELLRQGFTVSQVVHDYGDICQSITDLAVDVQAPISTEDFRTLNRTLDDAIASAVTEYTHGQDVTRDGASHQLQTLTETAIAAFEVLQSGRVGVGGSTGAVLLRSLMGIRAALVDRKPATMPDERQLPNQPPLPNRSRRRRLRRERAGDEIPKRLLRLRPVRSDYAVPKWSQAQPGICEDERRFSHVAAGIDSGRCSACIRTTGASCRCDPPSRRGQCGGSAGTAASTVDSFRARWATGQRRWPSPLPAPAIHWRRAHAGPRSHGRALGRGRQTDARWSAHPSAASAPPTQSPDQSATYIQ